MLVRMNFFFLSLVHRVPRSKKEMSATSETLRIFIHRGKFKMADFCQNVLEGENSNFPNVVILYTVVRNNFYNRTILKISWDISPDVEREFPILKRNWYSNCFLPFCWNKYFFNFEENLIDKTFKYNKILQVHLGASLKTRVHSFCLWSIHTERGE